MIRKFPGSSILHLQHREEVETLISRFEPYSDFNFVSLFSWNTNHKSSISILNNNLVINMPDYITASPTYSVIGDNQIDQTLLELLETTNELKLVPQVVIDNIENKKLFSVKQERNNFDYIYSLSDLALFPAKKYKKKRNALNAIHKSIGSDVELSVSTKFDSKARDDIWQIFSNWKSLSKQDQGELKLEGRAIKNLLDNAHQGLNLLLTTMQHEKKSIAFSINEVLKNGFAVCHFEKAIPIHPHIYSLLINQSAKDLLARGCKYVNWEQDLGLQGLRTSKLSYHPIKFLKKYSVSLR